MNVAVVTRFLHRVGGIETYLQYVLPCLAARGHAVKVWHEMPRAPGVDRLLPPAIPSWSIENGSEVALADLGKWKPSVVFLHGISNPLLEARFAASAPSVLFLHDYQGACISGFKTHRYPAIQPCSRRLGPACLLHYYPHRCGGLSPVSMLRDYARQRRRQELLGRCTFVTMISDHMQRECATQGVDIARTQPLPPFTPPPSNHGAGVGVVDTRKRILTDDPMTRWHLLFAGRLEQLKGGDVFLDALDRLDAGLRTRLRVTFAGEGRERSAWESKARQVSHGDMEIRFVGQLDKPALESLLQEVDLLVVPSIWPEPFGLIGIEAGAAGVPALAFDVGGISEWLKDNVNGRLVRGAPSARALAHGLEECIKTPSEVVAGWRQGARVEAERRTLGTHVDRLEALLERAVAAHA